MRILVIEDDRNKLAQIKGFLKQEFPSISIGEAYSFHSALKTLESQRPNLVVLDMSLPTYDISATEPGYKFRQFGGREILAAMLDSYIECPVIVMTQFPSFGEGEGKRTLQEMDGELRDEFAGLYLGYIAYNPSEEAWKEKLDAMVRKYTSVQ